jgi:hypothetical protein
MTVLAYASSLPWRPVPHCEWGSRQVDGLYFSVADLRGPVFGPTYYRQLQARRLGVICYAEGHLDASLDSRVNRSSVVLPTGASPKARAWASAYLDELVAQGVQPSRGQIAGGKGAGNISRVDAPAMLLEPGFVSNPEFAAFARTGEGIDALGRALARAIERTFPEGGLVALSTGHAHRTRAKLQDPGAPVADPTGWAEDPEWDSEVELVEAYLASAVEHLVSYDPRVGGRSEVAA